VELGRKIFQTLSGKTVLLIGAGETAELSARHLVKAGIARVLVSNRTESKAKQLVEKFGGEVVDFNLHWPLRISLSVRRARRITSLLLPTSGRHHSYAGSALPFS
jgi:shikimate 5-dehydrogenase